MTFSGKRKTLNLLSYADDLVSEVGHGNEFKELPQIQFSFLSEI